MARHLRLYMNNPTAGGVDGTEISSENETLPLSLTLDASKAETKADKVAVRTDNGFLVDGNTEIYFDGTNSAKWKVAADDDYSDAEDALNLALWQDTLTIAGVSATNSIFWVKAGSSTTESPQNDRSVDLIAKGLVIAAE